MKRPIPDYLRLHTESATPVLERSEPIPGLGELCRTFEQATGWPLVYGGGPLTEAGARDDRGESADLHLGPSAHHGGPVVEQHAAENLAASLAHLVNLQVETQRLLQELEAQPLPAVRREPRDLAELLERLLRAAANAAGCHQAGLYLLDDATTELKLRASWGLSSESYRLAPRKLREWGADVEALSGYSVVLDDAGKTIHWGPPEPCGAAVCLPVASRDAVLGTMWLYAEHPREFSDEMINVAEILAGRIAAELELDASAQAEREAMAAREALDRAAECRQRWMPSPEPTLAGWELAGWTSSDLALDGLVRDAFPLPNGRLALLAWHLANQEISDAMLAEVLRGAFRTAARFTVSPAAWLMHAQRLLWEHRGETQAACAAAVLSAEGIEFGAAGGNVWQLRDRMSLELSTGSIPLGARSIAPGQATAVVAQPTWREQSVPCLAGDVVVMHSGLRSPVGDAAANRWLPILRDHQEDSLARIAARLQAAYESAAAPQTPTAAVWICRKR